jgi:hypothetical protein
MLRNALPSLSIYDTTVIVQTVNPSDDSTDSGWPIDSTTEIEVAAFVSGATNADAVAGLARYAIVVLVPLSVVVDFSSRVIVQSGPHAGTYDVQEVRTTAIHHRILCRTKAS